MAADSAIAQAAPGASITAAVDLGWQVVALHRWSSGLGTEDRTVAASRLPGRFDLSEFVQARLLSQQIEFSTRKLVTPVGTGLADALATVRAFFDKNDHSVDDLHNRVRDLHLQILESVTVQDLQQAKAYSLGQILADTAAAPESSNGHSFSKQMQDLLDAPEIGRAHV